MPSFLLSSVRFFVLAGCPVCVPPYTLVETETGPKRIDSIVVGEKVLTHKGRFREVLECYKHPYDGQLLKIWTAYSNEPTLITPNHPAFFIQTQVCPYRKQDKFSKAGIKCLEKGMGHNCRYCKIKPYLSYKEDFIPVKHMTEGDLVSLPILTETTDISSLCFFDMLPKFVQVFGGQAYKKNRFHKGMLLPNEIAINSDFLSLVGYYLAEGCVFFNKRCGTLQFSFEKDEIVYIDDVIRLLRSLFGVYVATRTHKNTVQIEVYSWILAKLFSVLFGNNSSDKHVPPWMLTLPLAKQIPLFRCFWRGDGSSQTSGFQFTTSSLILAHQIRLILMRFDVLLSIRKNIPPPEHMIEGRSVSFKCPVYVLACCGFQLSHLSRLLEVPHIRLINRSKTWQRYLRRENNFFFKTKSIEHVPYVGRVHNLRVAEDESYVLTNMTVHNCRKLLGYIEGDDDLVSIFSEDCKVKHILVHQGFNLNSPLLSDGKIKFEKLRRGSQLRMELAQQRAKPNRMTDLMTNRLIKYAQDYGVDVIRNAIFIDRFEAINLNHPARKHLMYRYQIRVVPTVFSPYAPSGILRGLSPEESELEIERLLFLGGSSIHPAQDVTQVS